MSQERFENPRNRLSPSIGYKAEWLIFGAILVVLLWRFTYASTLYLSFFTDDFFYYAAVAKHFACYGFSSFNGLQATNGYHPLWMLTLSLLYRVFGYTSGHTLPFFVAVVVTIWLLIVGSYRALCRTQEALGLREGNFSFISGIVSLTFMTVLSRTGMEISLALFFLIMFWKHMAENPLEEQRPMQAVVSGLIASCAILGRIDCILAILLYGIFTLTLVEGAKRRDLLRNILPFALGLAPVAVYVAINWFHFHTLLPVSGMAKNLKPLSLSFSAVERLTRVDAFNILFTWPSIAISILYGVQLIRQRSRQQGNISAGERVLLCVLLQPVLFYSLLSFTSDWPLWTWYLYVFVPIPALLAPALLREFAWTCPRTSRLVLTCSVAVLCIAVLARLTRLNPNEVDIYDAAVTLSHFALQHPGRYAMGDQAGTPAWLMDQPVVQLEGLVGDKPFLNRIRQRENLLEVFSELGIDFYVSATSPQQGPCSTFREPHEAGPQSPVMEGQICGLPMATFGRGVSVMSIFDVRKSHP